MKLRLSIVLKTWQLKKYSSVLSIKYVENMIINQPQSNLTTQSQEKEGKIKTMVITIIAYTYSAPGTTQSTLHSLSLLTLRPNPMKKVLLSSPLTDKETAA